MGHQDHIQRQPSRPAPTSGSNTGNLQITYYKDDNKDSGEWDVWDVSTYPLPEGMDIGCPEVSRIQPDAVNRRGF